MEIHHPNSPVIIEVWGEIREAVWLAQIIVMPSLLVHLPQYQVQVIAHPEMLRKELMIDLRRQSQVQWQQEVVIIRTIIMKMLGVLTGIATETMDTTGWENEGKSTEVAAVIGQTINLTTAEGTITTNRKILDPQITKQKMVVRREHTLMTMIETVTLIV